MEAVVIVREVAVEATIGAEQEPGPEFTELGVADESGQWSDVQSSNNQRWSSKHRVVETAELKAESTSADETAR